MALKSTSSPIVVSTAFTQGVVNAFEVIPVDLQLNPLDQEVFVVTAVKIEFFEPPTTPVVLNNFVEANFETAICKSRPNAMQSIGDSNCIAYSRFDATYAYDAGGPAGVALKESTAGDSPPSQLEYLDIVATDNFFIALDGNNAIDASRGAVRVYGYRAKADAATYAALVQSEMLSA